MVQRPDDFRMTRRTVLKLMVAGGLCAARTTVALGRVEDGGDSAFRPVVAAYLASLLRPDGGYAWPDQPDSHLTPTFAVIGCYRWLGQDPPNRETLAGFVRTHHPSRLKKLEQERRLFVFQQVQSLVWLRADTSAFHEPVRVWQRPVAYLKQYEKHGYPVFQSEVGAFLCRELLGLSLEDLSPHFTEYLDSRRRANGTFNNTPATDGGDGHVMNTWWGFQAQRALGRAVESREDTVAWLRACQCPGGGFTYQPRAEIGAVDDVAYTWAAVRALKHLGAAPLNRETCLQYLWSLWNADGGFGDRPGWASNPMATYHALDALEALGALDAAAAPATARPTPARRASLPSDLKVFSIQIEAHGQGSPAEAVDLARALRIHLWGAKNAGPAWIARAQAVADARKAPVRFFASNEEYDTWVDVPGLGTYSHMSDVIAPAGTDFGPSLAGRGAVSWAQFREQRLAPLVAAGGRLIWQFGENEELVRMLLDDALARGGYAAISTFHFGNPDFTNSEPFLNRYRGRMPFIALQDAHGSEPWWFADMTEGFRTLFLAREPTWEGWIEALRENRVVAVRHDALSGSKTWMHGGDDRVLDFVRAQEAQWRWWDNPEIRRPLVSIVALTPTDESEAARPERGIAVRVRCAWENTAQGLPRNPITELVKLTLDGADVTPTLVAPRAPRGQGVSDHYHVLHLSAPVPGKHAVTAVVRRVDTGAESSRTIEFAV